MLHLLNLISGIALLVWATHLVRTGILRVFGENLRKILQRGVSNRFSALGSGVVVTGLLQSSTATCLIISSFVPHGAITLGQALWVMLGADIGTSLVALAFSFDLSWLSSFLIFSGVVLFIWKKGTLKSQIGRILIGLGLISLALQLISESTRLMIQAELVRAALTSLSNEIVFDMFVGVVMTVLSYSSLAVVLLTATLVSAGALPFGIAFGIVLGANLGSGILAQILTSKSGPAVRRVALGNLVCRVLGVFALAPFVGMFAQDFAAWTGPDINPVVAFHLAFNLVLGAAFIGFTAPIARLAEWLDPAPVRAQKADDPKYLDEVALATPGLALGCAMRETLHQADLVEKMLLGVPELLKTGELGVRQRVKELDDSVDKLYNAIKLYLSQISREALSPRESKMWTDIISYTIALEQLGDATERIVEDIEEKTIRKSRSFSEPGIAEINHLYDLLLSNFRLGTAVFVTRDADDARRLVEQKSQFKSLEREYAANHLARLQSQTVNSVATSSLHLDLLNEFCGMNSLICSVAYSVTQSNAD